MLRIQKKKIKAVIPLLCVSMLVLSGMTTFTSLTTYAAGETRTIADITNMQDMTQSICANSKVGDTATLTDTRDNSTYTIRKHEDKNCWMTQNLRLTGEKTLTPADSDVASNYTLPASDINGFSASNYYASQMYYAGDEANGAYYSWTAATAGTGDANLTSGDAPSSICPKGWKLPPNSGNGSYIELMQKAGINSDEAGSTKISSAPYNFPYAGYVYNGVLGDVGGQGDYWSRTIYSGDSQQAYRLVYNRVGIDPSHYYARYDGFSIRCVALGGSLEEDSNVAVRVQPVLTIDATTDMKELASAATITTGSISATISANTAYQVMLSADQTSLKSATVTDTEIPASSTLQPGTNAWGIATNAEATAYAAITNSPTVYYSSATGSGTPGQTIHQFGIGASISPALPAGTYSTIVTVTAAAL